MTDPEHVLETLRYGPDRLIVNPFDELVWLAKYRMPSGQAGLVDCCFAEAPCCYHQALEAGESPAPWVPELAMVQHWSGVRADFSQPEVAPGQDERAGDRG